MKEKFLNLSKRVGYERTISALFPVFPTSFFETLEVSDITFETWEEVYRQANSEKLRVLAIEKLSQFNLTPFEWHSLYLKEARRVFDEDSLNGIARLAIKKISEANLTFEESTELYRRSRKPYLSGYDSSSFMRELIGKALLKKIDQCNVSLETWKLKYLDMMDIDEFAIVPKRRKTLPSIPKNSKEWKVVFRHLFQEEKYTTLKNLFISKLSRYDFSFDEWNEWREWASFNLKRAEKNTLLTGLCVLKMAQKAKTGYQWKSIAFSSYLSTALKEIGLQKVAEIASDFTSWMDIYIETTSQELKDLAFRKMSEWNFPFKMWESCYVNFLRNYPPEFKELFRRKIVEKSSTKDEWKETLIYYASAQEEEMAFQKLEGFELSAHEWFDLYERLRNNTPLRERVLVKISTADLDFDVVFGLCFSMYSDEKSRELGLEKLKVFPVTFEQAAKMYNKTSRDSDVRRIIVQKVRELATNFEEWIYLFSNLEDIRGDFAEFCIEEMKDLAKTFDEWKKIYLFKDSVYLGSGENYALQKMMGLATTADEWSFVYNNLDKKNQKDKALIALVSLL